MINIHRVCMILVGKQRTLKNHKTGGWALARVWALAQDNTVITFHVVQNVCNQMVSSSLYQKVVPCSWICAFFQQQLHKFAVVTGASKMEWCQASFAREIDKWLCIIFSSVLHNRNETSHIFVHG